MWLYPAAARQAEAEPAELVKSIRWGIRHEGALKETAMVSKNNAEAKSRRTHVMLI